MSKVFTDEMSQDICERIMDEYHKEKFDKDFIFELVKQVPKEKINYSNEYDRTFLILAIENNDIEIAKYLLENGANVDGVNGEIPIMYALWGTRFEITELLLEYNANIDLVDSDGNTIIYSLVRNSSVDDIKKFINLLQKYNLVLDGEKCVDFISDILDLWLFNDERIDIIKFIISSRD